MISAVSYQFSKFVEFAQERVKALPREQRPGGFPRRRREECRPQLALQGGHRVRHRT